MAAPGRPASTQAGAGTTPTAAQRRVPRAAPSTKAAQHRMPVSTTGPLTLRKRPDTTAVTGPAGLPNGSSETACNPQAGLTGATAADASPC